VLSVLRATYGKKQSIGVLTVMGNSVGLHAPEVTSKCIRLFYLCDQKTFDFNDTLSKFVGVDEGL
jgi:hypothetical protein